MHYNTIFDAEAIVRRHASASASAHPAYLTNYIGVRIDPKFLPGVLNERIGILEGVPIPANWHADIAEFAAALRAVELSSKTFTMAELGCGWGCWMNITGVAAHNLGLAPRLIGVEADAGHIAFAAECCATNGFAREEYRLVRGVAAAEDGFALFPRQTIAGQSWGLEPIFGASKSQRRRAVESGSHDECRMVPLEEVIGDAAYLDLLHIDIQGGELDLISSTLDALNTRIAYMVIGTHSREIEGRLIRTLVDAGWRLEIERPAILMLEHRSPLVRVDGVQGWRNPRIKDSVHPSERH